MEYIENPMVLPLEEIKEDKNILFDDYYDYEDYYDDFEEGE